MKNEKRLQYLFQYLKSIDYVKPEDIPDIDLYMDQVTTFMDERLSRLKRHSDDKALTKTMINNYAKNNLLPPPVKKKYTKQHMLMLLYIYYFKGVLGLSDIETLLAPLNERFFDTDKSPSLEQIYEEIFSMETAQIRRLTDDVKAKFDLSRTTFMQGSETGKDLSDEDRSYLQLFSFLCELAFDVYLKKQFMEKIIDQLREELPQEEAAKKKARKNA